MRCKIHDLACAPDGRCIVCRRDGAKGSARPAPQPGDRSTTRRVWAGLGVAFAVMGAGVAYRTLGERGAGVRIGPDVRAEVSGAASTALQGAPPAVRQVDIRQTPQALPEPSAPFGPPSARGTASGAPSAAPAPAVEAKPEPPPPVAVSIAGVNVVVYTTTWCSVCKRAKAWMTDQGISYDERDIEASSEDARAMHAINPRGVIPTFDIEGDVLVGFSAQSLMAKMKSAALRDANRRRM